jgi:hypothetical protein
MSMRKAAILTTGKQLNGLPYVISVYDLQPAGLLIRAYEPSASTELTFAPSEGELDLAQLTRSESDLKGLVDSLAIVDKGGQPFLESSIRGLLKPKVVPKGDGVRTFISNTMVGEESLPELLTTGLAELCKAKPAGLDATRMLGQWLIDNNPNSPQVAEPEDE